MVLEAFLLIQMGFSGAVKSTESYNTHLFLEDNQAISIETVNSFPKQVNASYFLKELNFFPDSTFKSDTNKLQKGNPVVNDSITGVKVIKSVQKLSRKPKIESEIPVIEIASEPTKPEFILNLSLIHI